MDSQIFSQENSNARISFGIIISLEEKNQLRNISSLVVQVQLQV